MRRAILLRALLPLALLLAAAPAYADRASAVFFGGRADKSLAAKDFTAAEEHYRHALQEDPTFLPARYGLAQALLGLGRPGPALEELRGFVEDVKADAASPADWKSLAAKAEKQFADMNAAEADLQKVVGKYADDLVALARKWEAKDPEVAERAARRALVLRPQDTSAAEVLARVDTVAKGPPVVLFNGVDLKNWEQADFPAWQVVDGNVIGDIHGGSKEIRTQQSFEGDYDLRMEARFLEEKVGEDSMIMLLGSYKGPNDFEGVGLINRKVYFLERTGDKEKRIIVKTLVTEWKAPFDPTAWTVYELRFRGDEITALINGEVVEKDKRSDRRRTGFVGLYAQAGKVAFRKVEIQRR